MFKRRKHKLPKFPERAASLFLSLASKVSEAELSQIAAEVSDNYHSLNALSRTNPNVNKERLEEVFRVANYLIRHYSSFPAPHQALVVGALRYFVAPNDGLDDTIFYTGLDDDAKIFNYVLEEVGVEDQYIRVQGTVY